MRLRYEQGKSPTNVAEHLLRYENDHAVCPCQTASGEREGVSRDKGKCTCGRFGRRRTARDIQVIISEGGGVKRGSRGRFRPRSKFRTKRPFRSFQRKRFVKKSAGLPRSARPYIVRPERKVSRDFAEDIRTLSLSALVRMLRQFNQRGDDAKAYVVEKEIERRTKGFRRLRRSR